MDILPVVLAVCAIGLVGIGLVVVVGFTVLRRWAPQLMGLLGGAESILGNQEPTNLPKPGESTRRRTNLRDKAASLDFDSALARHQQTPIPPSTSVQVQRATPASAPRVEQNPFSNGTRPGQPFGQATTSPFGDDSIPPLRRKRRDRNQDEIFGGKLDEDGDGDLDF